MTLFGACNHVHEKLQLFLIFNERMEITLTLAEVWWDFMETVFTDICLSAV